MVTLYFSWKQKVFTTEALSLYLRVGGEEDKSKDFLLFLQL